jgi:hypothetical protein
MILTRNRYVSSVDMNRTFRVGQEVVYVATKRSAHPGPRAHDIRPETCGEGYLYQVDKFWIVEEISSQTLILRTRRGKRHEVQIDDPCVRPATFWERLTLRSRFPGTHESPTPPAMSA